MFLFSFKEITDLFLVIKVKDLAKSIIVWRDLTKVISILNYCRGPETDMSRPGITPGPSR